MVSCGGGSVDIVEKSRVEVVEFQSGFVLHLNAAGAFA